MWLVMHCGGGGALLASVAGLKAGLVQGDLIVTRTLIGCYKVPSIPATGVPFTPVIHDGGCQLRYVCGEVSDCEGGFLFVRGDSNKRSKQVDTSATIRRSVLYTPRKEPS